MEIIIEEITRSYKVTNRYKLDKSEVCIGRGYQNDVILSDPHISPEHLTLSYDGERWLINDKNSLNGSFLEDGKTPIHQHTINSGDVFSLGKSLVRIVFIDHPVEEAIPFSIFESLINFVRNPVSLAFSLLIFTFVAGYLVYLNNPTNINIDQLFAPAIGVTLALLIWPIAVALVAHLTKNEARIMAQVGVSFAFFNLFWLSDIIESALEFNFSSNWPISALFTIVPLALAFCLFWLNGYIGFHMTPLRRNMVAAGITALFFGGNYFIQVSNTPEFSALPDYNSTIMTPNFMLLPSSSVDKFLDDSGKLFVKVQEEAAKKE